MKIRIWRHISYFHMKLILYMINVQIQRISMKVNIIIFIVNIYSYFYTNVVFEDVSIMVATLLNNLLVHTTTVEPLMAIGSDSLLLYPETIVKYGQYGESGQSGQWSAFTLVV